jgi:hypothetical protein
LGDSRLWMRRKRWRLQTQLLLLASFTMPHSTATATSARRRGSLLLPQVAASTRRVERPRCVEALVVQHDAMLQAAHVAAVSAQPVASVGHRETTHVATAAGRPTRPRTAASREAARLTSLMLRWTTSQPYSWSTGASSSSQRHQLRRSSSTSTSCEDVSSSATTRAKIRSTDGSSTAVRHIT